MRSPAAKMWMTRSLALGPLRTLRAVFAVPEPVTVDPSLGLSVDPALGSSVGVETGGVVVDESNDR